MKEGGGWGGTWREESASRLDSSSWNLAGETVAVAVQVSWVPAALLSALFCSYLRGSQDCLGHGLSGAP